MYRIENPGLLQSLKSEGSTDLGFCSWYQTYFRDLFAKNVSVRRCACKCIFPFRFICSSRLHSRILRFCYAVDPTLSLWRPFACIPVDSIGSASLRKTISCVVSSSVFLLIFVISTVLAVLRVMSWCISYISILTPWQRSRDDSIRIRCRIWNVVPLCLHLIFHKSLFNF